jgi:hypothetical protein
MSSIFRTYDQLKSYAEANFPDAFGRLPDFSVFTVEEVELSDLNRTFRIRNKFRLSTADIVLVPCLESDPSQSTWTSFSTTLKPCLYWTDLQSDVPFSTEKARLEYRYFDVFIKFFLMSKGEHISLVRGDSDFLGSLQKMCEELPPKALCNDVEIDGGAKHNGNTTMSLEIYKPANKSQLDQAPLEELSGGDAGLDGPESMGSSSQAIQKYVRRGRPPSKAVQQQRAQEKAAEDRKNAWSAKLEMLRLRTNCLSSERDDLIHTLADKEAAYKSIVEARNRTDAENLELRAM